jgi:hypothetical protein
MANLQNTITFRTGKHSFEFVLQKSIKVDGETHQIYGIYINDGLSKNVLTVKFPTNRTTTSHVVNSKFSLQVPLHGSGVSKVWIDEFSHTNDVEFAFPNNKLFEITQYCNTQFC